MSNIRRIVHASDFSKASGRAFATAVSMAKSNRAALTILHVIPPVPRSASSATWEVETQESHWRSRQLATLADKARRTGVRTATLLLKGDPARQIVRASRSRRANLIVIGTHGRRGLSKLVLGSVAERVVRTAPCPVVTVRGR
jgi:nucleotide-binding universal stress UspA family protein